MSIKRLIKEKSVREIPVDGMPGFFVTLTYLSKDTIRKMADKHTRVKFNRKTGKEEKEFNGDDFTEEFVSAVVVGWRGLTYNYLARFVAVDESAVSNPDEEIPFTQEDALELMKQSTAFSEWVDGCLNDIELFTSFNSKKT